MYLYGSAKQSSCNTSNYRCLIVRTQRNDISKYQLPGQSGQYCLSWICLGKPSSSSSSLSSLSQSPPPPQPPPPSSSSPPPSSSSLLALLSTPVNCRWDFHAPIFIHTSHIAVLEHVWAWKFYYIQQNWRPFWLSLNVLNLLKLYNYITCVGFGCIPFR